MGGSTKADKLTDNLSDMLEDFIAKYGDSRPTEPPGGIKKLNPREPNNEKQEN